MTYLREYSAQAGTLFIYAVLAVLLLPVVIVLCMKKAPLQ